MVGKYGPFRVENRNGTLYFMHHAVPLEMIPIAEAKFAFRKSAGHAEFVFDDSGQVASVTLSLDAAGSRSIPKSAE